MKFFKEGLGENFFQKIVPQWYAQPLGEAKADLDRLLNAVQIFPLVLKESAVNQFNLIEKGETDMDIKAIAKSVIDKLDEKQVMEFLQKFADKETLEKVKGTVGDKGGDILNAAKNLLGGNK